MQTGWLIRINDNKAKNAEKLVLGSRETVLKEVKSIQERGDAKEENRFKVKAVIPYTEVDVDLRRIVKCRMTEKVSIKNLLKYFFDVNPLVFKNAVSGGQRTVELEIDGLMHEKYLDLVANSDGLISTVN